MKAFRKVRRPRTITVHVAAPAPSEAAPADWRALRSQILADKKRGVLARGTSDWMGPTAVVVPAPGRTRPLLSAPGDVVRELGLSDAETRIAVKLGIYSADVAERRDPVLLSEAPHEGYESDADVEAQYSLLGKLVRHTPVVEVLEKQRPQVVPSPSTNE